MILHSISGEGGRVMRIITYVFCLVVMAFGTGHAAQEIQKSTNEPSKKVLKKKLFVLDLDPYLEDKKLALAMSVALRNSIHELGEYEALGLEDLKAVGGYDAIKRVVDCKDDQCLLAFGRAFGTKYMVAGSLSKVGSKYDVSLRLIDTEGENAGVPKRVYSSCKCGDEELSGVISSLAAKLMGASPDIKPAVVDITQQSAIAPDLKESGKDRIFNGINGIDTPGEFDKQQGIPGGGSPAPPGVGISWWKWGLGVVLVGAIGAAAGGGGGGGSTAPASTASDTGTVSASW